MSFNLHNNHQLIPREQNYILSRKLLSIHSEDRDISKWKNSNEFEITLPTSYENVQSIRLIQASFPSKLYVFSNNYNNTKLKFQILGVSDVLIEIEEGIYTATQLAAELNNKLSNVGNASSISVNYNPISNKFKFISNADFSLKFHEHYNEYGCNTSIFNQSTNWGLGSYLGFDKKIYTGRVIESPNNINILGDNAIYMEIDKCNTYDEIIPYNTTNNSTYNNQRNVKVNSAFAKLIIDNHHDTNELSNTLGGKDNYGFCSFEPPLENLSKLKFKFRYHDGRLVDFKNLSFNFTIEVNCLINEIGKHFVIRKPRLL